MSSELSSFEHDGRTRRYVYLPQEQRNRSDVLVVALHPYGGNAEFTLRSLSRLHAAGFAILAPQGIGNSWNAVHCCGRAVAENVDDVGFVRELAWSFIPNKQRPAVFLTGFSNGAFLSSRIALEALATGNATWIKGLAMFSGYSYQGELYSRARSSAAGTSFPVLAAHGLKDFSVRVEGCCDHTCCCQITSNPCISLRQSVQRWAQIQSNNDDELVLSQGNPASYGGQQAWCYALGQVTLCEFPKLHHSDISTIVMDELVTEFFTSSLVQLTPDTLALAQEQGTPLSTLSKLVSLGVFIALSLALLISMIRRRWYTRLATA